MNLKTSFMTGLLFLGIVACQTDESPSPMIHDSLKEAYIGDDLVTRSGNVGPQLITPEYLENINESLVAQGKNYKVAFAEILTSAGSDEAGIIVLAKDVGNKQLMADFVPNDSRRSWSGANNSITYAIDQVDAEPLFGGLTTTKTNGAIERATSTWDNAHCSDLGLTRNNDFGVDIGIVAFLNELGGSPFVMADVQHSGFTDINFGGGILGVTFTFTFTGTDIDENGKADVAFREIYYDPSWNWADNGVANIDLETVAVHEIGHALSQGHFGQVAISNQGTLEASPRAVMNALYSGPFKELTGSDNGGHCNNWSNWPNN
jgi:hypothetical protein